MFPNLVSEMARKKITQKTIAECLAKSVYWVQNRLEGKAKLEINEGLTIWRVFFADLAPDYLFSTTAASPERLLL
jgi:hypothetical protein